MHQFIQTADGSSTLYVPELNEHYHSVHGAIQESHHIFITAGMHYQLQNHPEKYNHVHPLHILEAGFGTGLNAYLTLIEAHKLQQPVCFHTIEKYPLTAEEIKQLNYIHEIDFEKSELFTQLHLCPWEKEIEITPFFRFCKHQNDFREIDYTNLFNLLYFDAFNPDIQPHLWTAEVFSRFHQALMPEATLVTYCVKGIVKQALRQVGFTLKRLPGPPGKREMLRAKKS